jgi:4-amino-4-deoxy-L-arabinose transferase-like glycosyltransferase
MRFAPLVFALICLLVLFTGLDRVGFLDWREARDVQVSRELTGRREPLTPLLAHESWLEKPILAYAPDVVAGLIHGETPRNSRLMRALAVLALLLVTASIGGQHFGARAGWIAAGVLATSFATPLAARTDAGQALGALFGWVGCAGFADALFNRRGGRASRLVVAWGALAAALVIAGPLPALWPLGGLALYVLLARPPRGMAAVQPLAGLAVMLGLALPWYGAMIERHGGSFLSRMAFFPYAMDPRGPWYAGPVLMASFLVVGFFPWSALLPGAMLHAAISWRAARRALAGAEAPPAHESEYDPIARERHEEGAAHFFIACTLAALVPIAIYPAPPLSAALTAMPAAALLCARFLDHLFEDARRVAAPLARAVLMLAVVGSAGALLLAAVAPQIREASPELRLLASLLLVTSWAPFLANFVGRRRVAAALIALPVALGVPVVAYRVMPAMEEYLNTRAVAEAMATAAPPSAALVLAEPAPPSLRLYTRRNLVAVDSLASGLYEWRASDSLTYVAFRAEREHEVALAANAPLEIMLRTPAMVLARARVR